MNSGIIKSAPVSSANFREENWSERFLLKVYIILCYFSLIIFSTVELTSFATGFVNCARYKQNVKFLPSVYREINFFGEISL